MRRRFFGSKTSLSYMTIEAVERTTVELPADIEYSVNDGNTWKDGRKHEILHLQPGIKVSFRNMGDRDWEDDSFSIKGSCNLVGNCMSLIPDGKMYDYAFAELFWNCDGIISVSEDFLPSTILAKSCYYRMFTGCTSLTTSPKLPATTLAENCYYSMFDGCTNLTTAPELPATILAKDCYRYMFYGCSKLNYIKMLATDISASGCLSNWVKNISSTGTFVKKPDMISLPTGNNGIPSGWSVVNDGEDS